MKALMVLSHCGKSFLEEWSHTDLNSDFQLVVLSSKPKSSGQCVMSNYSSSFKERTVLQVSELQYTDVIQEIRRLKNDGIEVSACVTVWEGYRQLMAEINQALGAPDLQTQVLAAVRDKLKMRQLLFEKGLSSVESVSLSLEKFSENNKVIQRSGARWFVKPRLGVASFGAFEWTSDLKIARILELQGQAEHDRDLDSVLKGPERGEIEFFAEKFIPGTEVCFEVLVANGVLKIVAIHEKLELEISHGCVLENSCVSPPVSISVGDLSHGERWVGAVLNALSVDEGCFHIEARFNQGRWEVIEINCRVGGAYIYESARRVSGICMLSQWGRMLMERDDNARQKVIQVQSKPLSPARSYFRVFFAEPRKKIAEIRIGTDAVQPICKKIFLKPNQATGGSDKEVFAAQALWMMPLDSIWNKKWADQTKNYISINYQ